MEIKKIKELIEFIDKSSIQETEISFDDISIYVNKTNQLRNSKYNLQQVENKSVVEAKEEIESKISLKEEVVAEVQNDKDLEKITSPMVGTFYMKPAPDAPAFVKVGDEVVVGDTVCIIEAMKLMNEIKAPKSGVVVEICKNDGELVEFDDVLVVIK